MHDAPDATEVDGQLEVVRLDVVAEVVGPVSAVLDDAAIHVDDEERAVGPRKQVDRAEALVVDDVE